MSKLNNFIVTFIFITIIIGIFVLNLIEQDKNISITERRKLAQFPEFSLEKLLNGDFFENFENYAVDQMTSRDFFRNIKSLWSIKIFNQKDDNKMFQKDGAIYKMEYPLNNKNIEKSANKINEIYTKYLQNNENVYYAIIPEKNYYLNDDNYLLMDYDKLTEIMSNNLMNLKYIDIWNDLELGDFYKTDLHWKQECLRDVVKKIEKEMNLEDTSNIKYKKENQGEFYGTYYGQISTRIKPDELYILSNKTIENCITYNYETKKQNKIYDTKQTNDKYDIYLSGATPLITIDNPNAKTDRELLLFRDSFGSSIAPLLVENYKKITLIDIRYIATDLLNNYIDFGNQDVLFLYSSLILNQNVLK